MICRTTVNVIKVVKCCKMPNNYDDMYKICKNRIYLIGCRGLVSWEILMVLIVFV